MSKQSTHKRQQQHGPVLSPFNSATLKQVVRTVRTQASAEDMAETKAAPKQTLPKEGPRARYREACTTDTLALLRTPCTCVCVYVHACMCVCVYVSKFKYMKKRKSARNESGMREDQTECSK